MGYQTGRELGHWYVRFGGDDVAEKEIRLCMTEVCAKGRKPTHVSTDALSVLKRPSI